MLQVFLIVGSEYDNLTFKASPMDALIPRSDGIHPRRANNTGFSHDITLYPRFLNILGIEAVWTGKKVSVDAGFNRQDLIPIDDDFDYSRYIEYNFPLAIRYQVARDIELGVRSIYTTHRYPKTSNGYGNNDGISMGLSGGMTWQPTARIRLDGHAGVLKYDFDRDRGTANDISKRTSIIYGLSVEHQPSRRFTHTAYINHESDYGSIYNIQEDTNISYDFEWWFMSEAFLRGGGFYRIGSGTGLFGIDDERAVGRIGIVYVPNSSITVSFDYRYMTNDAEFLDADLDFTQNRFIIDFAYDF